jgi:cation transport protein ChaC
MGTMAQFWVFGYGSLMWNPGFAHEAAEPALVRGYHRSLCVLSHVHRGTPERPGLVLGLDHGGACHGVAYLVAPMRWRETLAYLRSREQVTMVYREISVIARLLRANATISALTYAVDRRHAQYARHLTVSDRMALIQQGSGRSGACRDYLSSTVHHLRALGIHDSRLEDIQFRLEAHDKAKAG